MNPFTDPSKAYTLEDVPDYGGMSSAQFNATVSGPNSAGERFAGVAYSPDFRTEEEVGTPELRRVLVGSSDLSSFAVTAYDHIAVCLDAEAIALSIRALSGPFFHWGEPLTGRGSDYTRRCEARNSDRDRQIMRELTDKRYSRRSPMTYLREQCTLHGLTPARSIEQTAQALLQVPRFAAQQELRHGWGAHFHDGDLLVLRAERGPAADMLEHLRDAINARTLGIGGATFGVGGIFLFDTRDVPAQTIIDRDAELAWKAEQKAKLEPVKAELRARGFGWFSLDRAQLIERDGICEVRYWLNPTEQHKHSSGWFTLAELLQEKFVKQTAQV